MADKEITSEQRKEIAKILFRGRTNLLFISIKFSLGLFLANLLCLLFGSQYLKDCTHEMISGFDFIAMLANVGFMAIYLNGQIKANSASIADRVKAVLNKQS